MLSRIRPAFVDVAGTFVESVWLGSNKLGSTSTELEPSPTKAGAMSTELGSKFDRSRGEGRAVGADPFDRGQLALVCLRGIRAMSSATSGGLSPNLARKAVPSFEFLEVLEGICEDAFTKDEYGVKQEKGKKYLFGPGVMDHIPGRGFGQMGMGDYDKRPPPFVCQQTHQPVCVLSTASRPRNAPNSCRLIGYADAAAHVATRCR